jgi:hypothetical protein
MTAERRELAADRLAWRVWQCIETAGEKNRAKRGNKEGRSLSKHAEPEVVDTFVQSRLGSATTTAVIDSNRTLEVAAMRAGRGVSKSSTGKSGSNVNVLTAQSAVKKRSTPLHSHNS